MPTMNESEELSESLKKNRKVFRRNSLSFLPFGVYSYSPELLAVLLFLLVFFSGRKADKMYNNYRVAWEQTREKERANERSQNINQNDLLDTCFLRVFIFPPAR